MADQIETITFNAVQVTGSAGTFNVSGTLTVNFSQNQVSGTLTPSDPDISTIDAVDLQSFDMNQYRISLLGDTANGEVDFTQNSTENVTLVVGKGTGEFSGNSNAPVTITSTCFVEGSLIRTVFGETAVEGLSVGDEVLTAAGVSRTVRWLGHRTIDCRNHPRPHEVQPVRISAHAFGLGLPARNLFLSPGHPVLVGADEDGEGGHLVPIMCLVNGTTIERVPVDEVTYWHVELDAHDILLAEGLPAESYIDLGSRPWFAGADGALYDPDFALPGMPGRCRPVAIDGPIVEAERRRLDTVFAMRLAGACAWPAVDDQAFLMA